MYVLRLSPNTKWHQGAHKPNQTQNPERFIIYRQWSSRSGNVECLTTTSSRSILSFLRTLVPHVIIIGAFTKVMQVETAVSCVPLLWGAHAQFQALCITNNNIAGEQHHLTLSPTLTELTNGRMAEATPRMEARLKQRMTNIDRIVGVWERDMMVVPRRPDEQTTPQHE